MYMTSGDKTAFCASYPSSCLCNGGSCTASMDDFCGDYLHGESQSDQVYFINSPNSVALDFNISPFSVNGAQESYGC